MSVAGGAKLQAVGEELEDLRWRGWRERRRAWGWKRSEIWYWRRGRRGGGSC